MRYDNLPSELKTERAWVNVWNSSKLPMQSGIRKAASSTLPETWSSYEEAAAAVQRGTYDGIGYVFHDTGLVGIDIDAGFEDCFLSGLAIDIIGHCGSYTEKSRSGRGVHILVKGTLPFKGRNNRAGVEIYQSSRYFIMTGDVLVYSEIVENQEALDYVLTTYFPDAPGESSGCSAPQRIYTPIYPKPEKGKVMLKPEYPPIAPGSRNLSLTSLAGQLHNQGYSKADIYKELLYANSMACKPPLDRSEVELIVNSVTRYRR
jgi:hypothetical protein